MQKLFASMLTAIALSLIGLVSPGLVPQAWAAPGSAYVARHVPCNGTSVKKCPGPRHPKHAVIDIRELPGHLLHKRSDVWRNRPEIPRPVRI